MSTGHPPPASGSPALRRQRHIDCCIHFCCWWWWFVCAATQTQVSTERSLQRSVCSCDCTCMCCVCVHTYDSSAESVLAFHFHKGSRNQTKAARLVQQVRYLLSHLGVGGWRQVFSLLGICLCSTGIWGMPHDAWLFFFNILSRG